MKKGLFKIVFFILLGFFLLAFSGCLVKPREKVEQTRTNQAETPEIFTCTTEACFKEKLANCEKASFVLREELDFVKTQLELSVKEKRGNTCVISVKLSEVELQTIGTENEVEERIHEALDSFFAELKEKRAECVFGQEDITTVSFASSGFLFSDCCSGELKDSLGSLERDIEKVIEQALGEVE